MRGLIVSAAAAAVIMTVGVAPASAKNWACQGPAYACGSKATAAKHSGKKVRKSAYNSHKSHTRTGKRARVAQGGHNLTGKASYYWQPQRVASGGWFNPNAMTAAHKTLPFGTKVRVTNKVNGKSVVVTINDRGPYVAGRVIDLSRAAAKAISMTGSGVAPVSVAVIGRG